MILKLYFDNYLKYIQKNQKSMNFVGSTEESGSESESVESDSSEEIVIVNKKATKTSGPPKSNVDLLLELDDCKF